MIAWPPISFCASTTITEAPASRATMDAGSPMAPEPITTISASRLHRAGGGAAKLGATRLPVATDAPATTAFRKKLRREKFADSAISVLWNSIYQDNSAVVWPSGFRPVRLAALASKIQSIG